MTKRAVHFTRSSARFHVPLCLVPLRPLTTHDLASSHGFPAGFGDLVHGQFGSGRSCYAKRNGDRRINEQ